MKVRIRSILVSTVLAISLAACAEDAAINVQSPETVIYDSSLGIDLNSMSRSSDGIYARDLIVGTGTTAEVGDTLMVKYTGYLTNGVAFDANIAGTFQFVLGAKQVIPGWEEGVPGMKIGGRRLLIIPPALAYGNTDVGAIPAGSVVIFAIELNSVK